MTFGGQGPYRPNRPPQPNTSPSSGVPPQAGPAPYTGPNPYQPYTGPNPYHPYTGPYPGPYMPTAPPRPSLRQQFREGDWPTLRELLPHARRVHFLLWIPFLFCFWGPLLYAIVVYPLVRSARRQARAKFPVHHSRIQDAEVVRVQRIRAWLALGASLWILLTYGNAEDWTEAKQQFLMRLAITPWLLLLTAPAVLLIIFRMASPSARQAMRTRLWPVVRSVLWYFGALTAGPAILFATVTVANNMHDEAVVVVVMLFFSIAALWITCFLGFASKAAVGGAFGTAQVHAALPALLTGVLVWELTLINLIASGMPPGPLFIQLLALIGGPASVTAVARWEIERLRTRYGVSLRA